MPITGGCGPLQGGQVPITGESGAQFTGGSGAHYKGVSVPIIGGAGTHYRGFSGVILPIDADL